MIYFDCKITGEVSLTIFQYVFFKKFFYLIINGHSSDVEEVYPVIEETSSIFKETPSIVEGTFLGVENIT